MPGSEETMDKAIRAQVERAVEQADLVVLLVDGKDGINPIDADIAGRLRTSGRKVLLAVNKLDELPERDARFQFFELGLGEPWPVSATTGKGSGDLLDEVVKLLPPMDDTVDETEIRSAVVGRPNAGKSSLVNKLLNEERLCVTPIAARRDSIDSQLKYDGHVLTSSIPPGAEQCKGRRLARVYSNIRTERAIDRADVCVLVVDARNGDAQPGPEDRQTGWDKVVR